MENKIGEIIEKVLLSVMIMMAVFSIIIFCVVLVKDGKEAIENQYLKENEILIVHCSGENLTFEINDEIAAIEYIVKYDRIKVEYLVITIYSGDDVKSYTLRNYIYYEVKQKE